MIHPEFALFAAFAVALVAIFKDVRSTPFLTLGLWAPTLWMMRCGSRSLDFWFTGIDEGRVDPMLVGGLLVAGVIILARRKIAWGGVFEMNWATFLFYGYLIISVSWAQTLEHPVIKIFRPLCDLTMALVVATEPDPRAAIMAIFRRMAYLLVPLSVVLIRYYPELGRMEAKHWGEADMWIGVTTHKNPLGQMCLVATLGLVWLVGEHFRKHKKLPRFPLTPIPLVAVFLFLIGYIFYGAGNSEQRSSTAILCLLIAFALYFVIGRLRDQIERLTAYFATTLLVIGICSLTLGALGTSLSGIVAHAMGKHSNLSDRTYLWHDMVRLGSEHPVLGAGYGAFWVPDIYDRLSPEVNNRPAQAHNGYLETYVNLGLVGVLLLMAVIGQSVKNAFRHVRYDFDYGRLRLVMLITICIANYTEASFPRGAHIFWFSFLMVAFYAAPFVEWPQAEAAEIEIEVPELEQTEAVLN